MAWFSRLSIRYRLILLMVFVSTLALSVAGGALLFMEANRLRNSLSDELHSLARLVADRSYAALVFSDVDTAQESLDALGGIPHVAAGCLFDKQGRLFAAYVRDSHHNPCQSQMTMVAGEKRTLGALGVEESVSQGGAREGIVQVHSTENVFVERLGNQLLSLVAALAGALIVSIWLAWRLQATISRPVAEMRKVADAIIDSGDYQLRAPELGEHELGKLARAFNRMLDTLHDHNVALAASEAYARRLFHDSHLAQIVAAAENKCFIDCNGAALRLFGLESRDQLIGSGNLNLSPVIQPDGTLSAAMSAQIWQRLEEDGNIVFEWRYKRSDGEEWDASVHMMSFEHRGNLLIHFSLEDITQRKRDEESLRLLNQELEARVSRRTGELADTNRELQATLESLRRTQHELVQREKLASLGALVAGVAHELNTPLGNSITVCSALEDKIRNLDAEFTNGTMKRSTLAQIIDFLSNGFELLNRNIARATNLVAHFKQAAVDQTSDQRRVFELRQAVVDVVETIEPQFKKSPHRMEVEISEGIEMDSYPGSLGQVVVNLALNALLHGFSASMQGRVRILGRADGPDWIVLQVEDNGCGIPAENLGKVFDPFFTTRLGQGGSGLGLHIVYNIVVGTLGGSIQLDSRSGEGTFFSVRIPRQAPLRAVSQEDVLG